MVVIVAWLPYLVSNLYQRIPGMAHDVTFSIPQRTLGRADLTFKVKKDGSPFGRLKVSKGSVVWVKGSATYGYKINWSDFDELMRQHGKHEKR